MIFVLFFIVRCSSDSGSAREIISRATVQLGHLSPGFSRGRHACIAKNNIYGRVQYVQAGVLVPLFAITQVTRGKKGRDETAALAEGKKKRCASGARKKRQRRWEQRKEVPSRRYAPWALSQSDLSRLAAASMREHSNLAIFARANLKKHERLTRAKMLLITRAAV